MHPAGLATTACGLDSTGKLYCSNTRKIQCCLCSYEKNEDANTVGSREEMRAIDSLSRWKAYSCSGDGHKCEFVCRKCLDRWTGPCPICRASRNVGQQVWTRYSEGVRYFSITVKHFMRVFQREIKESAGVKLMPYLLEHANSLEYKACEMDANFFRYAAKK
jgi:hypothetical protein